MIEQPSGWIVSTLGASCKIVSGGTPKRENAAYWGGSVPWVTPKDISSLDTPDFFEPPETISDLGLQKSSATLLPAGSILLSSRAPIGLLAIAGRPMATNQGFKSLVPGPELDSRFLYYAVKRIVPLIQERGNGATFKEVSKAVVSDIPISYPKTLAEQRRIAAILDKADGIRRKREAALTMANELLKSAFLEILGDPLKNEKEFERAQLGELVEPTRGISYGIVQRGSHVEGGIPVVRISNIVDNNFSGEDVVYTDPKISKGYRRTVLSGGEILLSIRGTVGRVAIAPSSAAGWNVSREVAVIPLKKEYSNEYVHTLMMMPSAQFFMSGNVKGVAQRGINLSDVRRLPVPLPPRAKLKKFLEIHALLAEHFGSSTKLFCDADMVFASLCQRAFRGEL